MRWRERLGSVALVAVLAAGTAAVLPTGTASAATPQCNRSLVALPDGPQPSLLMPAAGATWDSTWCWMAYGNMSDGVRALQRALVHCYQQNIRIDGEFGTYTRAALREAQRQMGADRDGVYGPQTRNLMRFAIAYDSNPITCWRAGTVGWPR